MRKVIENQLKIGQVDISSIEIDLNCRDEIPQLLLGLQAIYTDRNLQDAVFGILKNIVPSNVDMGNGRPGMDLWKILVLGTLRLNCNWDYDKLHNISNEHKTVREFLGHTIFDFDQRYSLQSLKDNIALFTPELLDEINRVAVKAGHDLVCGKGEFRLKGRCDELGVTDWRQYRHIFKKIRKQFNVVRRLKHSSSKDGAKKAQRERLIIEAHRQYVDLVDHYVQRAKTSIGVLNVSDIGKMAGIMVIDGYIAHAERQIDRIRRRVLEGGAIAHREKVFSIFEEHTEWISKGKAGVSQELGLGVCVLEDQYGFILHHQVMEHEKDVDIAVSMVAEAKRRFPALAVCSFDKGFYNPANRSDLGAFLEEVVLPKKGKLSGHDKEIEYSESFVESRRKHAAVESAINALENHGLDRCLDRGIDGFKRYIALAVLARNLQKLGSLLRERELRRQKRRRKIAA